MFLFAKFLTCHQFGGVMFINQNNLRNLFISRRCFQFSIQMVDKESHYNHYAGSKSWRPHFNRNMTI